MRNNLFDTSLALQALLRRELPTKGPYHAAHLHSELDVRRIIDANVASHLEQYSVVCTVTGIPRSLSTWELFQNYVLGILSYQQRVQQHSPAPYYQLSRLDRSGLNIDLEDHVSYLAQHRILKRTSEGLQNPKAAIVGMAGRFPKAADHEDFGSCSNRDLMSIARFVSNDAASGDGTDHLDTRRSLRCSSTLGSDGKRPRRESHSKWRLC